MHVLISGKFSVLDLIFHEPRGCWKIYGLIRTFAQSVTSSPHSEDPVDPEVRPPLVENTVEEGAGSHSAAQIKVLCVLKTDSLTLSSKGSVK